MHDCMKAYTTPAACSYVKPCQSIMTHAHVHRPGQSATPAPGCDGPVHDTSVLGCHSGWKRRCQVQPRRHRVSTTPPLHECRSILCASGGTQRQAVPCVRFELVCNKWHMHTPMFAGLIQEPVCQISALDLHPPVVQHQLPEDICQQIILKAVHLELVKLATARSSRRWAGRRT